MLNKKIMEKTYYIKNTRIRLPIFQTATIYLIMDKFNASPILWGVIGTIWGIVWLFCIAGIAYQEGVDVFKDNPPVDNKLKTSDFNERIKAAMKANSEK